MVIESFQDVDSNSKFGQTNSTILSLHDNNDSLKMWYVAIAGWFESAKIDALRHEVIDFVSAWLFRWPFQHALGIPKQKFFKQIETYFADKVDAS